MSNRLVLMRSRRPSTTQKVSRAARRAGHKVAHAKPVRKAPETAAAVWAGRRSGRLVRGGAMALAGFVTLRAMRRRRDAHRAATATAPATPDGSGPVPDPGAPATGAAAHNGLGGPSHTSAYAPSERQSATPPHGDKLNDPPHRGPAPPPGQ